MKWNLPTLAAFKKAGHTGNKDTSSSNLKEVKDNVQSNDTGETRNLNETSSITSNSELNDTLISIGDQNEEKHNDDSKNELSISSDKHNVAEKNNCFSKDSDENSSIKQLYLSNSPSNSLKEESVDNFEPIIDFLQGDATRTSPDNRKITVNINTLVENVLEMNSENDEGTNSKIEEDIRKYVINEVYSIDENVATNETDEVGEQCEVVVEDLSDNTNKCSATISFTQRNNDGTEMKLPTHDPSIMIRTAILNLKKRGGSSLPSIKKYIQNRYDIDVIKNSKSFQDALSRDLRRAKIVRLQNKNNVICYKLAKCMKPNLKSSKRTASVGKRIQSTSTHPGKTCNKDRMEEKEKVRAIIKMMKRIERNHVGQNCQNQNESTQSSNASTSDQAQDQILTNVSNNQLQTNNMNTTDEDRQCWVCFASDEDDESLAWVTPCRCSGTTKWVHHECLQRWIDEKQKGAPGTIVKCPQCGTQYEIQYPDANSFILLLDIGERLGRLGFPFLTIGVTLGGLYWCGLSYGAATIVQVCGYKRGLEMLRNTHPILLGVALPFIPTMLLVGKFFPWEDLALRCLRRVLPKVPLCRYIMPIFCMREGQLSTSQQVVTPITQTTISIPRTICGALFFPTISTVVGSLLFKNIESNIQRTLLGAATFVLGKGAIKIYHKQYNFIRQTQRKIIDFKVSSSNE